ncbi:hypothetical protein VQ056_26360 [Paenibacillus sp. JTLBN-2024]
MKTTSGRLAAISESVNIPLPPYLIISILTIFAIGPQYFINLSYIMNQAIIQNGLDLGSNDLLLPSTLSNIAFALGVPLGPAFTRKWGLRSNYLPVRRDIFRRFRDQRVRGGFGFLNDRENHSGVKRGMFVSDHFARQPKIVSQ